MKNLHKLLIIFLVGLSLEAANAQTISGRVTAQDNNPIAYATLTLLDSAKKPIDYAISTETGDFLISKNIERGYFLSVSAVGFQGQTLDKRYFGESIAIVLTRSDKNTIGQVVVTANKPLIEAKIGKIIYNVENTPLVKTSSITEILGKAPGVTVDIMSESIKLNGKQVLILMDGRKTYLDGGQVYQYLNNLQAGTIEKIELINNPSAKYDAGAIINIITKKDKTHGWNASLSSTIGHGKEPEIKGNGVLSYRNKSIALTTSIGANYDKSPVSGYSLQESPTYRMDQNYNSLTTNNGVNGRIALDYFLNKKHTLGFVYSHNQSERDKESKNTSDRKIAGDNLLNYVDDNQLNSSSGRNLYSLNYTAQLAGQKKLSFNADYNISNTDGDNRYYTSLNNNLFRDRTNVLGLNNHLLASTLDYEDVWQERYQIELGLKATDISTKNINLFKTINGTGSSAPEYQEDKFNYNENVVGGYFTISTQLGAKVGAQVGLRGELTSIQGRSLLTNEINKNEYFDLFPTLAINYPIDQNHVLIFGYNKSISRPSFRSLNPFRYYSDIYSATEGNPYLKASYSHEAAVQYLLKSKYMFTLGYMQENGQVNSYFEKDPNSDVLISKYENYGKAIGMVLGADIPVKLTNWWNTKVQLQLAQVSIEKENFKENGPAIASNIVSTFKLAKTYNIELTNNFTYSTVQGIYKVDPSYYMNLSIAKSFAKNKLSVRLHALDMFNLYKFKATTTQNNIFSLDRNQGRGAMYLLSLTYRLGKTTVKASDAKSKSIGEDANRL